MSGGRVLVNTPSHIFDFTREIQAVVKMILGLRPNAEKSGMAVLFTMDEGAQEKHI